MADSRLVPAPKPASTDGSCLLGRAKVCTDCRTGRYEALSKHVCSVQRSRGVPGAGGQYRGRMFGLRNVLGR